MDCYLRDTPTTQEPDGSSPPFFPQLMIINLPNMYVIKPGNQLRFQDGFTPLHRACWGSEQRHADTVRALLRAGVPYDQPADNGWGSQSGTWVVLRHGNGNAR